MTELLPFLVTGLVTGSLYGLAGMGLVLTYRTSGVFNFGHGAIGAGGAFTFYTLYATHGLPWPIAAVVTIGAFGVIAGFLMERITRGLGDVPEAVVVVATVGLLLAVQGGLYLLYGNLTRDFPDFLPTSGFTVSNVNITWAQVISVAIATTSAAALFVFFRRSRLGVAMRAVVDNPTLTSLSGERPARVRLLAWIVGCGFAALSGILLAPTLELDVQLLSLLVVQAFGACAIGLFTSLPLTFVGGLVIGVTASISTKYLVDQPFSGVPASMPFLVLIVVLLVAPPGKLPKRRQSDRALVTEPRALSGRSTVLAGLVVVGGLLLVPRLVGAKLPVWTNGLTLVIIFASLGLLVWTSGQISLCHGAFAALGATTMSHLTGGGMPWVMALLLAGVLTIPIGAVVAVPAIRLSGIYLALVTAGFAILMQNIVYPTGFMFGTGLIVDSPRPVLGPIDGSDDTTFYFISLTVTAVCLAALVALTRTRLGRLLRAMSESPTMLSTHGLRVNFSRLIVFCISAFFAGIGGALAITQTGSASGVSFSPVSSLVLLVVLALAGRGSVRSALVAALLLGVLPSYLDAFGLNEQTFGFGAAAVLAAIALAKREVLRDWIERSERASRPRPLRSPVKARRASPFPEGVAAP